MNATALIRLPAAAGRAASPSDVGHNAAPSASEHPTFGELIPLIGAVAGYGPPVVSLVGPWLLLGLMLSGPFAFLVILVVFMLVAATVLVALTAAIFATVAAPYVLLRRLREHRAHHALSHDHTAQLVPVESPRVVA